MRRMTVIKHTGTAICGHCNGFGRMEMRDFTRVDIDGPPSIADEIARVVCDFEMSHAPGRLALSKANCDLADRIVELLRDKGVALS